jgi:hypothetical protein
MSNIESDQVNEDFRSSSEVDFYIHNDMVHIADTKVATRFSDFFIRQMQKINEVTLFIEIFYSYFPIYSKQIFFKINSNLKMIPN